MEYCGSIWDPYTQRLEAVQKNWTSGNQKESNKSDSIPSSSGRSPRHAKNALRPVQWSSRKNKFIQIRANKKLLQILFYSKNSGWLNSLPPQITAIEDKTNPRQLYWTSTSATRTNQTTSTSGTTLLCLPLYWGVGQYWNPDPDPDPDTDDQDTSPIHMELLDMTKDELCFSPWRTRKYLGSYTLQ